MLAPEGSRKAPNYFWAMLHMDPAEGQSKATSYAASFSVVCVLLCREKMRPGRRLWSAPQVCRTTHQPHPWHWTVDGCRQSFVGHLVTTNTASHGAREGLFVKLIKLLLSYINSTPNALYGELCNKYMRE